MHDAINIAQPGKVVGKVLKLGTLITRANKLALKMTGKSVSLGDGLEVTGRGPLMVNLSLTAAAARRLGWPHPGVETHTKAELGPLYKIIGSPTHGETEKEVAYGKAVEILRWLAANDPDGAVRSEAGEGIVELDRIRAQDRARFNGLVHG